VSRRRVAELFSARAITANRNWPFLLYLAFNAPHPPLQALRSDYDALPQIQDHTLRVYGAMVRALDRGVIRDVSFALRVQSEPFGVGHDDRHSLHDEALRQGEADARSGTRHDGDSTAQLYVDGLAALAVARSQSVSARVNASGMSSCRKWPPLRGPIVGITGNVSAR
jgi:hypothetical protein